MAITSASFGVELSNVPIVNLRNEFRAHYRLARNRKLMPSNSNEPLRTPYLTWLGMPNIGATLILTRIVLSLEAYMSFAAEFGGAAHGHLSREFKKACRNPFLLGGRGTADNYYNRLPRLISADLPMSISAPAIWPKTREFYSEVRNPLFHGHQLSDPSPDQLATLFEQVAVIYRWIDGWFDPEPFLPGSRNAFVFD